MTAELRELPEASIVLRLNSPPFPLHPPTVRHAALTPPDIAAIYARIWANHTMPAKQIRIARLQNVVVAREGLVFDTEGRLFASTVTGHGEAEIAAAVAAIDAERHRMPVHAGPHVLCKKRGAANYGHWLIEMLPTMCLAQRHLAHRDTRYIVPAGSPAMTAIIDQSADQLGVGAAQRLVLGDEPAFFSNLFVMDELTAHGTLMSPLLLPCIDALAAEVRAGAAEKLLVVRSTSRRFANHHQVVQAATTAGYVPVDPGQLSLGQQIAVFKGAREIVGVTGAALTNIVFAPPGTAVTALAPANMPDTFFWLIASLRDHHYREVRCRQTGPFRGPNPWDNDIIVDPADFPHIFARQTR